MSANYGLAALTGLLSGASKLPVGMQQRDELDLQRERLDETKRQFDEGRSTDLSALAPILKAAGMDTSALPTGKVSNTILPTILSLQQKKAEQAAKAASGQAIAGQLEQMGTTTSMAPGASVEMPKPGGLLAPPAQGPMPALTQKTVDPRMAALAKLVPGLLQTHPETAGAMLKDVFIPPKPVSLGENSTLVDPRTGQPIGPPRDRPEVPPFNPPPGYEPAYTLDAKGGVKSTTWKSPPHTPLTDTRIENALRGAGWSPEMQGYDAAYLAIAKQIQVPPGGGIVTGEQLIIPPPPGARRPATTPMPASPGPLAPTATTPTMPGPVQTTGGGGGIVPKFERPPSPEMGTHYLSRNTWQPPPANMTLTQIQRSGEYVQIPTARVNSLSQGRVVKGMLDELESIIVKRPDLFPVKAAGAGGQGLLDNILSLGKAKGYSMIPGAKDYDPDLARLSSLSITLPSAVKAFGDTANIAVKEREIAEQATGLRPGMQDAALARVDLIRRMINDSIQTAGMPPFPSLRTGQAPAAATMPPSQAPSSAPGGPTPQAGKPPVEQRYKQLRDSGMTKEQAGQRLKQEGYVLP